MKQVGQFREETTYKRHRSGISREGAQPRGAESRGAPTLLSFPGTLEGVTRKGERDEAALEFTGSLSFKTAQLMDGGYLFIY